MSTLRSAIELKNVFEQIQAAERAGNLSPEEKKKLEEQAAEKGLQALFKVRLLLLYIIKFSNIIHVLGNQAGGRICSPRDLRSRPGGPLVISQQGSIARRSTADPRRSLYGGEEGGRTRDHECGERICQSRDQGKSPTRFATGGILSSVPEGLINERIL